MLNREANFLCLEVGFNPNSKYSSSAPFCRWFSHSGYHSASFDLRICCLALLKDCVLQDWGLTGALVCTRASVSAISFPLIP